jgi:hypothetical protein
MFIYDELTQDEYGAIRIGRDVLHGKPVRYHYRTHQSTKPPVYSYRSQRSGTIRGFNRRKIPGGPQDRKQQDLRPSYHNFKPSALTD